MQKHCKMMLPTFFFIFKLFFYCFRTFLVVILFSLESGNGNDPGNHSNIFFCSDYGQLHSPSKSHDYKTRRRFQPWLHPVGCGTVGVFGYSVQCAHYNHNCQTWGQDQCIWTGHTTAGCLWYSGSLQWRCDRNGHGSNAWFVLLFFFSNVV